MPASFIFFLFTFIPYLNLPLNYYAGVFICNDRYYNLIEDYLFYKDRIPQNLLPIGEGSFGDLICISVDPKTYGKVYFWTQGDEAPEGGEPWWENVFLIANSFTDFINSLYALDVEMDTSGELAKTIKTIITHDKYSLPYYTRPERKYSELMKEFFSKAPAEVEDYVIEEIEDTHDLIFKYEVKSENKRYIRSIIDKNGEYKDWVEAIEAKS